MDDIKPVVGTDTPATPPTDTPDPAANVPVTGTPVPDPVADVPGTTPVTSEPPAKKPADVKDVELPGEGEGTEAAMPETPVETPVDATK